ncbi:MAG: arginine--tRNA ligase [Sulfolobales archaeon]
MSEKIYEPYKIIRDKILRDIGLAIGRDARDIFFEEPVKPELGDIALPIHRISRELGLDAEDLAGRISTTLEKNILVERFARVGGYIDIWISSTHLASALFTSVRDLGELYGVVPVERSRTYVVEYVSANPIHPLHIGSGRNAALGSAVASMLRMRGHKVVTRFYVNDMGRQIAIAVLGFRLLGEPDPPPNIKEDEWIGFIYASTHTIYDVKRLREELEKARIDPTRYREILSELDDLVADAARLREMFPEYFDKLADEINKIKDFDSEISRLMQAYEKKSDEDIVRSFRKLVDLCLRGFKRTLERFGVEFDKWDFESDIAWSGLVNEIIERARRSPYYGIYKNAPAIIFRDIQKDKILREKLRLPRSIEIPPLIIMRSDETTLYTLRDIAYSIYKFRDSKADYVINVIASEQTLPQAQIRLALYALGFREEAERLIHYSYEMVNMPGTRMSGRRGRYVTLDQVLGEAVKRAESIMRSRGSQDPHIAEKIAVSAVRYSLASVSPSKQIIFKLEEALDFERNSAPYILYSRARALSILNKIGERPDPGEADYIEGCRDPLRRQLILELAKAPTIYAKAVEELSPEGVAVELIKISDLFNTWYQKDPVIHEQSKGLRAFKILMVEAVVSILSNGLKYLGIEPLDRI